MKIIIIIVSHVCPSYLLRVSWCVLCFMLFLFEYMCTCLPFIWWSIAGVPSSQALPVCLMTAPQSVCVPAAIGVLAVWIQQQQKKKPTTAPRNSGRDNAAGIMIIWWASPPRILHIHSMLQVATDTPLHVPLWCRGIIITIFHGFGTSCMVPYNWD